MGRKTNIIISTNRSTKTQQKQTVWFGDGEIRLNGETGQYIGKYEKNGAWWNAEVHFGGEVQELSQPTATQAAEAVAWAWLACKALEGFAEATAPVLEQMEEQEQARIMREEFDREVAEQAEREAAAEATWQECRAKGGWWYIVTYKNNLLVFNAAEERAFYTTPQGELYREVEARDEVNFALTSWNSPTIYPYVGEVWAYYFRASFRDSEMNNSAAHLFCTHVAFDKLETPEQVSAYIFISESEELDDIPEWAMNVEFRWKLSFLKAKEKFSVFEDGGYDNAGRWGECKARREEQRTIIADCK